MIELEKTYLIKHVPFQLNNYPYKELIDHYMPVVSDHPQLRLRKRGESYEITKKTLVNEGDCSIQKEQTIQLSKAEYEALSELPSKKVHKIRYYIPYGELILELDVFQDDLDGLILMDVEFPNQQKMALFDIPDFCIAEVTQNPLFAGGMLCGKSYSSLISLLRQYMGDI